jgi:hypothetical protein
MAARDHTRRHHLTLRKPGEIEMPKSTKASNRHPVDKLFDLREQIKALQAEEKLLRDEIMSTGDTVGADYIAIAKSQTQKRLDRDLLNVTFGKPAVDACCKEIEVTTLNLFRKADIGGKGLLD